MLTIFELVYYFTIYSFIGWIFEFVYTSIKLKRLNDRGYLYGPFCPIYGFAALLMIICLAPVKTNLLIFFIACISFCTGLELFTGIILKKIFHKNLWDYSKRKYNFLGIICLKFSLIWGILSFVFMIFIHPMIESLMVLIPIYFINPITYIFLFFFIINFIIATYIRKKAMYKPLII